MVFLELRRDYRVTKGISGFLLCWPREAQSSIRVARESWGLRSSHCAEGSGAGGVQTAKASRKQSSLSGKESAQGCIPKRLLGRLDEALGGGNQGDKVVYRC